MAEQFHKGNKIDIPMAGTGTNITLNDQPLNMTVSSGDGMLSTPLAYGEFTSPEALAKAVVDTQLAMSVPTFELTAESIVQPEVALIVRKNVAELSDGERNKFRDALFTLKERGEYDKYIKFHGFTTNLGHFGPAFFPWHRVFLHKFEQELRQIDPDVTLPYWNYTSPNVDAQGNSKIFRNDFLGTNGNVSLTWTGEDGTPKRWVLPGYNGTTTTGGNNPVTEREGIRRRNFPLDGRPVNISAFNSALGLSDYTEFEPDFEGGPHGGAHVFLGTGIADQGNFATAVNDPFFMLLHCNVDRMWSRWQQLMKLRWETANPGMTYPPGQLAKDYYWDKSDASHTAPNAIASAAAPNRHNLPDSLWPWDGTRSHSNRPDSQFVNQANAEIYTPLRVLNHESLGYTYDTLVPTEA